MEDGREDGAGPVIVGDVVGDEEGEEESGDGDGGVDEGDTQWRLAKVTAREQRDG